MDVSKKTSDGFIRDRFDGVVILRDFAKYKQTTLPRDVYNNSPHAGGVVSGVRRMNEVKPRRTRIVPGWVTVFGRLCHLGM